VDAHWYDVAPPFMAFHDPPLAVSCPTLARLALTPRAQLPAENVFLRKQLALYQERCVKPRRPDPATRVMLVLLSRLLDWRSILTVVKPDTLIRWHRQGWWLFWRRKSRPGRPPIPRDLQRLIVRMARSNPTWSEERIAHELRLKLGLTVSPRTVGRYFRTLGALGAAGNGPSGGRGLCGIMRTRSA
jgi:putative transposase